MAWYEPSRIFALFRARYFPRVVDGTINPSLLAIARRGYWVQSRLLRLPDRFGFFSSGPPLLQAHQGRKFATLVMDAVVTVVTAMLVQWWWGVAMWWHPITPSNASILYLTIFLYVEEVFSNPLRAPDYDWEAMNRKMGLVQPSAEESALAAGGEGCEQGCTGSAPEEKQSDT